jgi:hypothetical protein
MVADLCGVTQSVVHCWLRGKQKIPGGLPLTANPGKVGKRPLKYCPGGEVIAIARHTGRPIPEKWDKLFPTTSTARSSPANGQTAPKPPKKRGPEAIKDRDEKDAIRRVQVLAAYRRATGATKSDGTRITAKDFCEYWNREHRDHAVARKTIWKYQTWEKAQDEEDLRRWRSAPTALR